MIPPIFVQNVYEMYIKISYISITKVYDFLGHPSYIHENLFAPQAQDLLEKLAEMFLNTLHREHILLKLKIKILLRKIKSKNLTAGVVVFFSKNAYNT